MKQRRTVRPLTVAEYQAIEAGLDSQYAYVLRRCQIILNSSRGERAAQIARWLGCDEDTVVTAVQAFNDIGLASLSYGSTQLVPRRAAFKGEILEHLREMVQRSPREFGKHTDVWTLELVADVTFEQGLTSRRVRPATIHNALTKLGIRWKQAKVPGGRPES